MQHAALAGVPPAAKRPALPVSQRRRAQRLAVWNAAVWAIGNGLASTTLVVYLARELHAERLGLGIGLMVAAPQISGLLRLGAPALIERLGSRKRFCLASFLLSALLLLALPWLCAPERLPTPGWSLAALISLWCLYHPALFTKFFKPLAIVCVESHGSKGFRGSQKSRRETTCG